MTTPLEAIKAGKAKCVPFEPTEEMWGGLARQIVMWMRMGERPTGRALYAHLDSSGWEAPEWLREEIPDNDHVPPKGTVATCIYKAMLAAAPTAHALLSQVEAAPAIPDGWQLVPKEPTVEQLEAMPSLPAIKLPVPENLKHLRPHQYQNRERYIAALAVAPTAPQSPAQVPSVEEVARVIDPRAFESLGVLRGFAGFEAMRKKEQTNALEKATAILALFKGEKK